MGSGVSRTAVGAYVGTGASLDVKAEKVDFKPRKVEIFREGTPDKGEWVEGMADDSFVLTTGSTGVRTEVTANGITPLTSGFTVGTHASLNTDGDVYRYVAHE
jgi:hypothetical protein